MSKVVMAMSGGVDSSAGAAILKEQGYEVIGVTMNLLPPNQSASNEAADAQRVARHLGIPHYVVDFPDIFAKEVISQFCQEYPQGRTPNPCIQCNRHIKFGALFDRALEMGADYIATGHYARIEKKSGRYALKKGVDPTKDQSYVLYTLTQEKLARIKLPLGTLSKKRVRQIASQLGLPLTQKPESQEICFIPDNNYARFLSQHSPAYGTIPPEPGPIVDGHGHVLGTHRGITHYTIGQRRGLGIAASDPLYVTAIDPKKNVIVVGTKDETYSTTLIARSINWIDFEQLDEPIQIEAKIRYRHTQAKATLTPMSEETVRVDFETPQMSITPGQAVVFYDGDRVVGGGTIDEIPSSDQPPIA